MFNIVRPDSKIDFLAKARLFGGISIGSFVIAVAIIAIFGLNLGLDFSGGHEILLEFDSSKNVQIGQVRERLDRVASGDIAKEEGGKRTVETAVQSFEVPTSTSTFFLARIERQQTFGEKEIQAFDAAFRAKYKEFFKRVRYNPDAGDVVEVEFVDNATTAMGKAIDPSDLEAIVAGTQHEVRLVRDIGRPDRPRYSVVLKGIGVSVVNAMHDLDPTVRAARVEFVGPTVGRQLRDDGLLAVLYALMCILVYIALRFDVFYSPGAIICLFHDAVVTVALLAVVGEEFSLATIAGLLTLVGYSINDTIVVFDRIRETAGKAQGTALREVVNRAVNETLGRTIMTSSTTLIACICLMALGRGTVLASFGEIMFVGIILGTYSSIYVAAPIFIYLRERFGPKEVARVAKTRSAQFEV